MRRYTAIIPTRPRLRAFWSKMPQNRALFAVSFQFSENRPPCQKGICSHFVARAICSHVASHFLD